MIIKFRILISTLFVLIFFCILPAQNINLTVNEVGQKKYFNLRNDKIECVIVINQTQLESDILKVLPDWKAKYDTDPDSIKTDANFSLEVMYTDWFVPGKVNNADNSVKFSKKDFKYERYDLTEISKDVKELNFFFKGIRFPLQLKISYRLESDKFYIKRKIALSDTTFGHHFLQKIWAVDENISDNPSIIKNGGFGQPIALEFKNSGAFYGLEYPTSLNNSRKNKVKVHIECGQEIGELIGKKWIESDWAVKAITPNKFVKLWFFKYLDDIRVMPVRPYILYNSWYDIHSPDFKNTAEVNIMNEKNVLRIIDLFRKNMYEKFHINLDAFVLDDGWDIYKSDWVLRNVEFPNGLKPITDELKKMNTKLGLWFGPTGGYSFRDYRIGFMKEHGYEIVFDQLCLAGKKYKELFKKRVTDFVDKDGVGYYKWDGIQFSCSEPDHGHPVDIYSRRAVMNSLIKICNAVREKNPEVYLNITSGTWLSPWWLKYANQIWMQGEDFGYADVPSISPRDASTTYRDFVLFEDFKLNNFWFPLTNMMTHGIIKGSLNKLGGEDEPLDKFTNESLLYLARGVSMRELYISPDILTEDEWSAMAKSIIWAKDRFPILYNTEMIGGDPKKREAYGYVHFKDKKGIIAARNPSIESNRLKVILDPSLGLDPYANSLVLERVYPTKWISPKLYSAGASFEIPLDGYEFAVYEIYPLEEAISPLLAGVTFSLQNVKENEYQIKYYDISTNARILNPEQIKTIKYEGKSVNLSELSLSSDKPQKVVSDYSVNVVKGKKKSQMEIKVSIDKSSKKSTLAILLKPSGNSIGKDKPEIAVQVDGKKFQPKIESKKGLWSWYLIDVSTGKHVSNFQIEPPKDESVWMGKAYVWFISQQEQQGREISFETTKKIIERPMPPLPFKDGIFIRNVNLGEADIIISVK